MKVKLIAGVFVACAMLASAPTLLAHHAGTMFNEDVTKELSGTVKEFQFTNPHSWIQVVVETAPGKTQEWSIEWGSPNQLARQGIRPSTFLAGTKVTMKVPPMRDGSPAGIFMAVKFADGKVVGKWDDETPANY